MAKYLRQLYNMQVYRADYVFTHRTKDVQSRCIIEQTSGTRANGTIANGNRANENRANVGAPFWMLIYQTVDIYMLDLLIYCESLQKLRNFLY